MLERRRRAALKKPARARQKTPAGNLWAAAGGKMRRRAQEQREQDADKTFGNSFIAFQGKMLYCISVCLILRAG